MILFICSIILLCSIALFLLGILTYWNSSEFLFAIGLIFTLLDLIIGFGAIATGVSIREEISVLPPSELAKSQYAVYMKCENATLSSTDAKIVATKPELIKVRKETSYNSYGVKIKNEYSIITADEVPTLEKQ